MKKMIALLRQKVGWSGLEALAALGMLVLASMAWYQYQQSNQQAAYASLIERADRLEAQLRFNPAMQALEVHLPHNTTNQVESVRAWLAQFAQTNDSSTVLDPAFSNWRTLPEFNAYLRKKPDFWHPTKVQLRNALADVEPFLFLFEQGWQDHEAQLISDDDWQDWEADIDKFSDCPFFWLALHRAHSRSIKSKPFAAYLEYLQKRVQARSDRETLRAVFPEVFDADWAKQ